MRGPIRLRMPRTPSVTPSYSGPAAVPQGWYLAVVDGGGSGADWMAHLRHWSGHEMPSSPGAALVRAAGPGRRFGVVFFPGTEGGAATIRLYGVQAAPAAVSLVLLPIPRAFAAPSVILQNLPALRARFAAAPGSRLARLRAGMALAATLGQAVPDRFVGPLAADLDQAAYRSWITRFDTLGPDDRAAICGTLPGLPPLLVLCRFDTASAPSAPLLIQDLRDQLHTGWRAVLDCTPVPTDDARIGFGSPPDSLRDGECLVVLDSDLRLRPHSLAILAAAVQPGTRLVYADEDRIGPHGERIDPFFKPDFSPELLRHLDYLGGCILLAGSRSPAALLAQDPAGLPRETVVHLPLVLSHHLHPRAMRRQASEPAPGRLPSVSIVIPTRDRLDLLCACLDSIQARTAYDPAAMEIIVVDNASTDPATLAYLRDSEAAGRMRVLHDPGPFNYPDLNNKAVAASRAEVVVFLNNDTEIADPTWLRRLATLAMEPDVGAVGCKLLYPDRTVQHAGVVTGMVGIAGHVGTGLAADDPGPYGLTGATREVAAVTAACLAIRRTLFFRVGGFDPELAVAFNDVVLCLALLDLGQRNICVAEPLVIHHESKSRGHDDTPEKAARFFQESILAWRRLLRLAPVDPYYSPNLAFERLYGLAYPPRREKPWFHGVASRRVLLLGAALAATAMDQQAAALRQAGYEVWDGRLAGLAAAQAAASFAVEHDIGCVVAHTPPFFSVLRWLGPHTTVILCDHGEPPPGFFLDAERKRLGLAERLLCLAIADHVLLPTADLPAYVSNLASQ